ncbi:MAG: DUF427 domain-containing protein [Thermomicrobiales bacterium]
MARAIWNDTVLAESDQTIIVENNHYFPPDAIKQELFQPSDQTTIRSWKGTANYYDLVVSGERNPAAAWFYADPKDAAAEIKNYVAFWNGVRVEV